MLPREENELLTRVGHETAMSATMRLYWIPASLARELSEPDGPPVRVRRLSARTSSRFATAVAERLVGELAASEPINP